MAWAFPASADAQDEARAALAQCLGNFDGTPDATWEDISAQCASLPQVLAASSYSTWLPHSWWQAPLRPSGLQELADLIDRLQASAGDSSVDPALLGPVLEGIKQVELKRSQSWLERFRQWLRDRLHPGGQDTPGWMEEWDRLVRDHERLVGFLEYTLFVLILAFSVGIVLNELKAAGVIGGQRDGSRKGRGRLLSGAGPGLEALDSLESLERSQRPSRLLELVLTALAGPSRARSDRALTHRELQRDLRFDVPAHASGFERLVRCAERVRYSPRAPAEVEIDSAVTAGRELLAALGTRS